MAPFGLKLGENAFQMIPDISFFDGKNIEIINFLQTLNDCLPPEDGSVRFQTLRKSLSDDPPTFHLSTPPRKHGTLGQPHPFLPAVQLGHHPEVHILLEQLCGVQHRALQQ